MSEFIERLSVEDARNREPCDLETLAFLNRHFELILVSTLLIVVAAVVNWVPDKLAFLHFFYLPVLAAGYLLGASRAILIVVLAKRMRSDHPQVLEIVATHHELLNSEGYPHRKKGDEIPIAGRICGVADVYCALTSWRSFREPWDSRVALGELRKGVASGMYDANVVETLCELMS